MATKKNIIADFISGAWSLLVGLKVTLKSWFGPKITVQYPFKEKLAYSPRYRGRMVHLREADGRPKCTACQACVKACPANVISVEGDDKKGRERRAKFYEWRETRCMFCNLCVEACPFDAIKLLNVTDVPAYDKADLTWQLERLLEPWDEAAAKDAGSGAAPETLEKAPQAEPEKA